MNTKTESIVLRDDEILSIRIQLIEELKDKIDFSDPTIYSTIWAYLDKFEQKAKNSSTKNISRADIAWTFIKKEYKVDKTTLSKRLNKFIKDEFKRGIILRDIGTAYSLLNLGFYKESVIISGGVIEEILRLFLQEKQIKSKNTFVDYIKTCEENNLLKSGISKLSDFLREFRNLVHLSREKGKDDTVHISVAKSAVSSMFTIIDELNK